MLVLDNPRRTVAQRPTNQIHCLPPGNDAKERGETCRRFYLSLRTIATISLAFRRAGGGCPRGKSHRLRAEPRTSAVLREPTTNHALKTTPSRRRSARERTVDRDPPVAMGDSEVCRRVGGFLAEGADRGPDAGVCQGSIASIIRRARRTLASVLPTSEPISDLTPRISVERLVSAPRALQKAGFPVPGTPPSSPGFLGSPFLVSLRKKIGHFQDSPLPNE